jgi:hypothetical protein
MTKPQDKGDSGKKVSKYRWHLLARKPLAC